MCMTLCCETMFPSSSRLAHTKRLVPATLVLQTVHMKRFEEKHAATCPKTSNQFEFLGLVTGTKLLFLQLDYQAKIPSSHDDLSSPCELRE